jgi:hypothetical protein
LLGSRTTVATFSSGRGFARLHLFKNTIICPDKNVCSNKNFHNCSFVVLYRVLCAYLLVSKWWPFTK